MLPRGIRTRLRAFDIECELAGPQPVGVFYFKQATLRPIALVPSQKYVSVAVPYCLECSNVLEIEMQLSLVIGQADS
ncbi:hypothetical protein IP68_08285 [Blastomonas sp. AAP25]|nr:hypothetical protein IP68_08285 [Blastomonas sp. AAP25]